MNKQVRAHFQSSGYIYTRPEIIEELSDLGWTGAKRMISVTRMNGTQFYINATMIELIESTPDTVLTLSSGRKYVIKDSASEIYQKITEYYHKIGLIGIQGAVEGNYSRDEVE